MMYESAMKIIVKFPCFTWSFSAYFPKKPYYTRKTEVCFIFNILKY